MADRGDVGTRSRVRVRARVHHAGRGLESPQTKPVYSAPGGAAAGAGAGAGAGSVTSAGANTGDCVVGADVSSAPFLWKPRRSRQERMLDDSDEELDPSARAKQSRRRSSDDDDDDDGDDAAVDGSYTDKRTRVASIEATSGAHTSIEAPSRAELRARGLQDMVEAVTTGLDSWSLTDLSTQRQDAFGADQDVVKTRQDEVKRALLKTSSTRGSGDQGPHTQRRSRKGSKPVRVVR